MLDTVYPVLIVDDSAVNRSYLHYILDEEGYRVIEASSGEACLVIAEKDRPLLILLDVIMGGIDGFETLKRLKANSSLAEIPVIMLTSLDDEESKLKAFELGAVDYIVKSARPAEIKARVRVHIRLSMANQELLQSKIESMRQIKEAQHALLIQPADFPDAHFAVYYQSLHEAGGDFYDVIQVAEDVYLYVIVDVAGHEVGTSFITPAVKVLLKQFSTPTYTMEETFSYMGNILAQTVCQDTYLTAAALRVNRRSLKATYLTAGHPPILHLLSARGTSPGECRLLKTENPPVAMLEGFQYRSETIDIAGGDRFILCTDGLLEVRNSETHRTTSWLEGMEYLQQAGEKIRKVSLDDVPYALVNEFAKRGQYMDDVAVICVEV
ncbi:MAG: fused response regulator/phosphatase [Treponemataceae bacterium]|nr:fused response regulator/phosphatase [Treponemataceae bacterium]